MADALDIPAIIKAQGVQGQQASQIVPQILPGYNPAIQNTAYNPAKASQLLAGLPNVSKPLVLAYAEGDNAEAAEIVKELNAAGFNVQSTLVQDFSSFETNVVGGDYDMYIVCLLYTSRCV